MSGAGRLCPETVRGLGQKEMFQSQSYAIFVV